MNFSVKLDGIEEAKKLVSSRMMKEVLKYTMEAVTKGAAVVGKNKIKEGYNIRPSDLNKAVKVKAEGDGLTQTIQVKDASGHPLGIFELSGKQAVQTSLGTWVQPRKDKGAYFIPQAFVKTMPSSHKGVFIRLRGGSGKGGRLTRRDIGSHGRKEKNPPIHEIYGPWISSLFGDDLISRELNLFVVQNAQRIFNSKLDWKTGGLLGGNESALS